MKIVIADCSAIYTGRGDTILPRGIRTIMIKEDGTVSIHNDEGIKPLNYMKNAFFSEERNIHDELIWNFDSRKESLKITIHQLKGLNEFPLIQDDPGLMRDGTEDDLQKWLSYNTHIFGENYKIVSREYPTGNGPVDLLILDNKNKPIAVEVKRTAMLASVDQCRRYVEALKDEYENNREAQQEKLHEIMETHEIMLTDVIDFSQTIGMIAAVDIRPKTYEHASKKGIHTFVVPYTWKERR